MSGLIQTGLSLFATEEGGEHAGHHGASYWGLMVYFGFTLLILFAFLSIAKSGFKDRVFKNKWSSRFEQVYLFIESMCVNIIGPHGRRYVPFIITFWLVIFVSNIVGLFFAFTPTADLGFNLGMALISIGYVQWEGMRSNGVLGHFKHFAGPKLGLAMIPITLMIFIIEIISEAIKNVSLSLRLFGNIEGGHKMVEGMNTLGTNIIGPLSLPFGFFLLPIKVLTVVVQALIFSLLTCVYISLVTHHEEEHHEDHGHSAAPMTA
ncbi:MAG: F0F1 ATP synthase subunit A [Chthonomonadaceae bacterium]|nr:F0F1 ATP synthase subunit A [Chthonomonadaceae bacterium]